MNRSKIDKLISWAGLVITLTLVVTSGTLYWAYTFAHGQVHDQLAAQKIFFPAAGSTALASLPQNDKDNVSPYAGQQLTTGAQAEVFADHYIAVHLQKIGGGKTYSELSTEALAHPDDQKLAQQVNTVFRGETLRGMLLNAYAFDTMALVAYYAALGALVAGLILFVFVILGFRHAASAKKQGR